jgi:hypothetical protein
LQLKFHHEQRELAVFAITVAKSGPKMTVSAAGPDDGIGFGFRKLGDLTVHNMTMAGFCSVDAGFGDGSAGGGPDRAEGPLRLYVEVGCGLA